MSSTKPYIDKGADGSVTIIGDPDDLEALGHALILKAKLGSKYQCIIKHESFKGITLLTTREANIE